MLEHSQRRTYKPISLFFVALIVLQGFFASVLVARGQAEVDWGFQNPTSATVTVPTDPTAKASGGSTTKEASTSTTGCTWSGWPSDILTCVVQSTLLGLRDLMGWLAGGAASLFVWVVDPANVTGPTGMLNKVSVYNLWKFIRDFFNLFFILILLFSAFSTIFQIEAFSIRKVFFNILLAALIINFSFPITRFLIDMTNVPMYYFLNVTVDGTSGGALKITESLLGASGISSVFMGNSNFWQLVMNVIFVFLFAISLLVLAVLMLIRVIALVLLVIFSPIGFAASLLPGTEKLGRDWWNYFWKYAFFGPSAALMLMVSVRFMNEIGNDGTFGSMVSTSTGMSAGAFQSSALAQITFLTIPIILIWSAIGMANSASIAGAGKVTGWGYGAARKAGSWMKRGTLGGAGFVGRKVEKKMAETKGLRWMSPTVLKTAWKARSEEQKHKDEAPVKQAAAQVQDSLNKGISAVFRNPLKWRSGKGVEHTEHEFAESQRQAREKAKEITEVSDSGDHVINEALHAQDLKKIDDLNGALLTLAKNNDLNDWVTRVGTRYIGRKDKDGNDLVETKNGKVVVSSKNAKFLVAQALREAGEKNEELLAKRIMAISDSATASGNFAFGGMTKFDPTLHNGHGGFRQSTDEEQAQWAAGKVKNLESQRRQVVLHPDSLFTRTEEGFGDINDEVAEAIVGTFTQADVDQVNRSRDDLKEAIHQAWQNKSEKFMALYEKNDIFKSYVQSVVKMKRGMDFKKPTDFATFEKENPPGVVWDPQTVAVAAQQQQEATQQQATAQSEAQARERERKERLERMRAHRNN